MYLELLYYYDIVEVDVKKTPIHGRDTGMKKFNCVLMITLLGLSIMVSCATLKTNIEEPNFIDVPGGLNKKKITTLWKAAKNECFDLSYTIASEDKDSGNLICQKIIGESTWTLSVQINGSGFKVNHHSSEVADVFNPYIAKWKKDMEDTLLTAAGM